MLRNLIAFVSGFTGLLMMMGASNDCDGRCMEQANTFEMTLLLSVIGLALFVFGLWLGRAFDERV